MNEGEVKKCYSCGGKMQFAGKAPFRIGGTSGGWKLLFGEWAELGEEILPIYIFVCSKCGRLDLFVDEKTQERLSQGSLR